MMSRPHLHAARQPARQCAIDWRVLSVVRPTQKLHPGGVGVSVSWWWIKEVQLDSVAPRKEPRLSKRRVDEATTKQALICVCNC